MATSRIETRYRVGVEDIRTDLEEALTNQTLEDMEQIDLRTRSHPGREFYMYQLSMRLAEL